MTQEQYEELYNWVYEEIHHNRDSYSRSKIIEMIMDKAEKLVNKANDIHDVSLSFEAKEKIIDLHGYVTEIEEVDGDVVWFYDQNGEYMSLRKKYVKRYSS